MESADVLFSRQEAAIEQLSRNYSNYNKSPKERLTQPYIETRLENVNKLWDIFCEVHYKLIGLVEKKERNKTEYFKQKLFDEFEDTYTDYKTKLKRDLNILKTQPSSSDKGGSVDVKLPQIQLPTFSGGYQEWQTFYDMFVSLIHKNQSLNPVQKLHYLKSSLNGEPENLLKNLATTEANYDEAWCQLTRRYNNKRFNSNEILKRLFSQKTIISDSATAVKQLLDTTSSCLKSLNNLGIDTSSWDVIINHLIINKLDSESRKQWEVQVNRQDTDDLPTWSQLTKFLETRFRTLEMLDSSKTAAIKSSYNNYNMKTNQQKPKSFHSLIHDEKKVSNITCMMCSGQHYLFQCKQFGKQSPEERSEFVQSKRLCFNCLAPTHSVKQCHQATCCRRCGRRHHSLLHFEKYSDQGLGSPKTLNTEKYQTENNNQPNSEQRVVAHFTTENKSEVLLATALVRAKSKNGYTRIIRALIDQGSEASFVTEDTVQSLGLKKVPVNGLVSGVGEGQTRISHVVSFNIESIHNPEFKIDIDAYVLSTLTSFLPSNHAKINDWPDIQELPLADPKYGEPRKVDVILGVEILSEIILGGLIKHPTENGPIAQFTKLGWVLSGRISNSTPSAKQVVSLHLQLREDQILKQFWEIEREPDYTIIKKKLTKEELLCEEFYESTTDRDKEGRYIVRLPFKEIPPKCLNGKSKEIALQRFVSLEKKLVKNPKLYEEYKNVMTNYIKHNHMIEITETEQQNNPNAIYLPHHAVVKENKDTTKVRVVFDASCKGVNGVSLNDTLLIGPKLQQDLRHILMRWRRHPICIIADLEKMYLQVKVHPSDCDFQRILWRFNPRLPIKHYKLLRLTFGTSCAPHLAVRTLLSLAKDEQASYPIAAKILMKDYYVDDLLTGAETEKEAIKIYDEMNRLMSTGGFKVQKWCSNSQNFMNHTETNNNQLDECIMLKHNQMVKVLGICWNKQSDNFGYTLQPLEMYTSFTKRKVLSAIGRLYDPMGWIAPVIITAKIYIQTLWKSGLSWDEEMPQELINIWLKYNKDLCDIRDICVPRWLHTRSPDVIELHAFADASSSAYAAAVYLKSKNEKGEINVNLITGKTKVAPIEKEISIPRLELCAGLLAARLLFEVSHVMEIPKEKLFAWTDSTILLAWLRGEPSRWTTFVSNRVSEILTMTDKEQWRHISTDQNPADCASRGISVMELKNHKLWWHGPELLRSEVELHPEEVYTTEEEKREIKVLNIVVKHENEDLLVRFSSLQKALRVLAYCKKFLNLKQPIEKRNTLYKFVTAMEIDEVLQSCIKEAQNRHFAREISQVSSHGSVNKRSRLNTLNPILDENGILRVDGRINLSHYEYDIKHPMILPNEAHLTKLIIANAHIKTLHGGPQLMLNFLRSRFWIIKAREMVKKHCRECVICIKYLRKKNNPLMGQLPEARLKPSKPFNSTGVDFTGHINIRFSPGRGSKSYKGYICLFICMSTRAIHLEAVSDLTTQGFIAAFRRFVSRRGYCKDIYSDNGTNFVGACKELRIMFNKAVSQLPQEISQILANEGTTWHFIPPHAPNFGGLWEAGVRSTKTHLKRVIGDSTLTYEELSTVLTQVEACLNSRPISFLSNNPDDPLPLTPGHFLVGEPLILIPDGDHSRTNIHGIQRWKLTQKMVEDFWKRWSEEYLVTLNQRFKWTNKRDEPHIDDVVIIRDDNIPPAKWLLGRVIEKHPGKDNITRVVSLKTKNGVFKRPCNKLCFLPIRDM